MPYSRASSSATSPTGNSRSSAGAEHDDAAFNFTEDVPEALRLDSLFPAQDQAEPVEVLEPEFWMVAAQTHHGAALTERMASFMKAMVSAQAEFATKLASISSVQMARTKAAAAQSDSPVTRAYWNNVQTALRLCRHWATMSKEMTASLKRLIVPMDRLVTVGRQRLKETATWNVELNKALSVFHTNIAKRQAKCYKALGSVMTPDYFENGPSKKARAVRRAAPTVQKYVEQIDEANIWLNRYMERRPTLMGRLRALEQKRFAVSREVLSTYASSIENIGALLTEGAHEMSESLQVIDDDAAMNEYVLECRKQPTPHLEEPPLFEYHLPVAIQELGIKAPRNFNADPETFQKAPMRPSMVPNVDQDEEKEAENVTAETGFVADETLVTPSARLANTGTKLGSMAAAFFNTVTGKNSSAGSRPVESEEIASGDAEEDAVVTPMKKVGLNLNVNIEEAMEDMETATTA